MNNVSILVIALSVMAGLTVRAGASEAIDTSYPAERIEEIVVETAAGPISLSAGSDQVVRVTAPASGDECEMTAKVGGGVLTLLARGLVKKTFMLDRACMAGFSIIAPAGTRIKARTVSGPVDVGEFSAGVDVKTGAGDIFLRRPSGHLTLHTGRGSISGAATGPSISAVAQYGAIELRELTGSVTARSGEAGVSLTWVSAPGRGEIRVETTTGHQTVALPSGTRIALSMRSDSGVTTSEFVNEPLAKLQLQLRSTTGAIAVKKLSAQR
ncbi:MAG: hypothetical protein ACHQ51_01910 [Elusimicrobiota bacterium]